MFLLSEFRHLVCTWFQESGHLKWYFQGWLHSVENRYLTMLVICSNTKQAAFLRKKQVTLVDFTVLKLSLEQGTVYRTLMHFKVLLYVNFVLFLQKWCQVTRCYVLWVTCHEAYHHHSFRLQLRPHVGGALSILKDNFLYIISLIVTIGLGVS